MDRTLTCVTIHWKAVGLYVWCCLFFTPPQFLILGNLLLLDLALSELKGLIIYYVKKGKEMMMMMMMMMMMTLFSRSSPVKDLYLSWWSLSPSARSHCWSSWHYAWSLGPKLANQVRMNILQRRGPKTQRTYVTNLAPGLVTRLLYHAGGFLFIFRKRRIAG